jgi:hypothetical protein
MARIGWKLVMLCSGMLLSGCGEDDDTGDSRPVDVAEYGVWGVEYRAEPEAQGPLPDTPLPAAVADGAKPGSR